MFLNHKVPRKEGSSENANNGNQTRDSNHSTFTHECPPFALINPDDQMTIIGHNGKKKILYGRNYPWGFCDAFSDDYSDFGRLYKLIISKFPITIISYR
jgi:septin family protein